MRLTSTDSNCLKHPAFDPLMKNTIYLLFIYFVSLDIGKPGLPSAVTLHYPLAFNITSQILIFKEFTSYSNINLCR